MKEPIYGHFWLCHYFFSLFLSLRHVACMIRSGSVKIFFSSGIFIFLKNWILKSSLCTCHIELNVFHLSKYFICRMCKDFSLIFFSRLSAWSLPLLIFSFVSYVFFWKWMYYLFPFSRSLTSIFINFISCDPPLIFYRTFLFTQFT